MFGKDALFRRMQHHLQSLEVLNEFLQILETGFIGKLDVGIVIFEQITVLGEEEFVAIFFVAVADASCEIE